MRRFFRAVALALYYGLARYLPRQAWPGGRLANALRIACARVVCEHVGSGAAIEPGVDFGSGRLLRLGARSGIGARSTVGALHIGDDVMIGPELLAIARNHRFDSRDEAMKYQGYTDAGPSTIGDGAWVGARVTLLPGVRIGAPRSSAPGRWSPKMSPITVSPRAIPPVCCASERVRLPADRLDQPASTRSMMVRVASARACHE